MVAVFRRRESRCNSAASAQVRQAHGQSVASPLDPSPGSGCCRRRRMVGAPEGRRSSCCLRHGSVPTGSVAILRASTTEVSVEPVKAAMVSGRAVRRDWRTAPPFRIAIYDSSSPLARRNVEFQNPRKVGTWKSSRSRGATSDGPYEVFARGRSGADCASSSTRQADRRGPHPGSPCRAGFGRAVVARASPMEFQPATTSSSPDASRFTSAHQNLRLIRRKSPLTFILNSIPRYEIPASRRFEDGVASERFFHSAGPVRPCVSRTASSP